MVEGKNLVCLDGLLCDEDESFLTGDSILDHDEENPGVNPYSHHQDCVFVTEDEDDEYIEGLFMKEPRYGSAGNNVAMVMVDRSSSNWFKSCRLQAIQWILKTQAAFGFQRHTSYLSILYFDRFLSERSIEGRNTNAVRLLSVACLSLAAKMEEQHAPGLSEFEVEDIGFESNVIKKMELMVFQTLGWKLTSITPFHYLNYFITKFSRDFEHKVMISTRAMDFVMAITKEINLLDHRPSIIAVAAVLAAIDGQFTTQAISLKLQQIPFLGSEQNEHVNTCYNIILQTIEMGKKTPNSIKSPTLTSIHSVVLEDSFIPRGSGGGAAKRSLTFNISDQTSSLKKICRL